MLRPLRLSTGLMLAALLVAALGTPVLGFLFLIRDYPRSRQELVQRHTEATSAIELIYAYYLQHRRWPDRSEVEAPGQSWLPAGWEYESTGTDADMSCHGPNHMFVYYHFTPPNRGTVSRKWMLTEEGDESTFQASVIYSPNATP